ncbi:gamma-aminobutyric acid type B receptor subunit 1-like [Saccoglossus kowalevskii]
MTHMVVCSGPVIYIVLILLATTNNINGSSEGDNTSISNVTTDAPTSEKIPLVFMGLMSWKVQQGWNGGGVVPAIEMALSDVNSRTDILAGYELKVVWGDDQCIPGKSVRLLFEQITNKPVKIMILGAGCSTTAQAFAGTAPYFNLIQVGASESSPKLSNIVDYPSFIRLTGPDTIYNEVRIAIINYYGWKRVATIYHNMDFFAVLNADLVDKLGQNNITIITADTFMDEASNQVRNMINKDARIIIVDAYEPQGKQVLCEAHKQGLYGGQYVWFLIGWYNVEQWRNETDTGTDCTYNELYDVIEGSFIPDKIRFDESGKPGVSGMTFKEFEERYKAWPSYEMYGPNIAFASGYDTAWAAALTLNKTSQILAAQNFLPNSSYYQKSLENFTYGDTEMADTFYRIMKNLKFRGVSGEVRFDDVGDRRLSHSVSQIRDGRLVRVGTWHSDRELSLQFHPDNPVIWSDGGVPVDGLTYMVRLHYVPVTEYAIFCGIAITCMILAVGFLYFNVAHMTHP